MRPDMVRAVASLSVPFTGRAPWPPIHGMRQYFGDRFFYQIYFQTPGVAEHELQHDIPVTMRKMLYGASGAIERSGGSFGAEGAPPASSYMLERMPDPGDDLPAWLTAEDVNTYVEAFTRSGFRGGLNWYRNIDYNWVLTAAFDGMKIEQPALFVAGDRDVVPFGEEAEQRMRAVVTDLRDVVVLPGHRPLDPAGGAGRGQRGACSDSYRGYKAKVMVLPSVTSGAVLSRPPATYRCGSSG